MGRLRTLPLLRLIGLPAATCLLAACSSGQPPAAGTTEPDPAFDAIARGTLAPPDRAEGAVTYNPQLAPAGARVEAAVRTDDGTTEVSLDVDGLLPNRGYAAHVHVKPCGATGAEAGPHYQDRVDPAAGPQQPSSDPAFANPSNEVWLDLRTDANGSGESSAVVPFLFIDRRPGSVVVHEAEVTGTDEHAGMAGARLACLTIPPA
jgi:Cu-Zn family superoxide dismutase